MIDSYLSQKADLDDRAIHLLFSANRWERACVPTLLALLGPAARTPQLTGCASYHAETRSCRISRAGRPSCATATRSAASPSLSSRSVPLARAPPLWPPRPSSRSPLTQYPSPLTQGLSPTWCRAPDIGLPAPDLVLFLHISPSAAQTRGGFGNERYETPEIQLRVEREFAALAESVERGVWTNVDAERGVESVGEEVRERVDEVLRGPRCHGEVARLWEGVNVEKERAQAP